MAEKTTSKVERDTAVVLGEKTQEMIRELQDWAQSGEDDRSPAQIAMDIVEQILNAPSLEEASGATADIPLGIPLTINIRAWQPSDIGTFGVFAVMECVDGFDLENKKVVTCGANNVVPILYRAQKESKLPLKAEFREVETKQGFKTLWLDLLPE